MSQHAELTIAQRLTGAVLQHYLEESRPATVKDIAALTQLSRSTIHRHINKYHGMVDYCDFDDVEQPVYSRDCPSMVLRHRMVDAWSPSKSYLAQLYKDMRSAFIKKQEKNS